MGWFGIGKPRTKLGSWLDSNGIKQDEFKGMTGLSDDTISRAANNDDWMPTRRTAERIMDAVNSVDEDKTTRDFWGW